MYPFESRANRIDRQITRYSKEENLLCSAKLRSLVRRSEIRQRLHLHGQWRTQANAIFIQYSFRKLAPALTLEELLAAAHAGCFTMALSAQLGRRRLTATKLETTATISLEKVGDGFSITKSHLDLTAKVPGADKAKFDAAVKNAKPAAPSRNSSKRRSPSPPGLNPERRFYALSLASTMRT